MWKITPFVDGHQYLFLVGFEVFAKEGFAFFLPFFRIAPGVHKYLREMAYRGRVHYVEFRRNLSSRQAARRKLYLCP